MPSTTPMPDLLARRALDGLNHLLRAQPAAAARLQPHAAKRVSLEAGGMHLGLVIGADGLLQSDDRSAAPDLTLRVDLAELLAGRLSGAAPGMRGVAIAGDAELAQAVAWLQQHLRWDAEDDLARLLGDIAAHRVARAGAAARAQGVRLARQLERDTRDWLAEAPRALVTRAELGATSATVAQLRDTLARLDKRIALLEQRRSR